MGAAAGERQRARRAHRRGARTVALGALGLALAAGPAVAGANPSIAVVDLEPASDGDADLARVLTPALVQAVAEAQPKARVLGFDELKAMLDVSAAQQLLGCEDERCYVDASKKVAADRLVVGTLGRAGGQTLIFLSLIDPKQAVVLARTSGQLTSASDVAPALATVARSLFNPAGLQSGDRLLRDLRTAVLFDEYQGGTRRPVAAIEGCLNRELSDVVDGAVADPTQVGRLKKQLDPKHVLESDDVLDNVTWRDVDVLLVGTAERKEEGVARQGWSKKSQVIELTYRLVAVDTGTILASDTAVVSVLARGKAGREIEAASNEACQRVMTTVKAQLDRRVARGFRVSVEVAEGANEDTAAGLAASLAGIEPWVLKARPRGFQGGVASVDVRTRAVDGHGLVLLMKRKGLAVDYVSAGPSKVTLKLKGGG